MLGRESVHFDIATELQWRSDFSATIGRHRSFSQIKDRTTFSCGCNSVCSVRDQSSSPSKASSSEPTLNIMASSREIVPIGGDAAAVTLYDDTNMNGSNGLTSPIVVEPNDGEGLIVEMPECAFYMYAP